MKYNIYIICKFDDFEKIKSQFNKYKNICHIHWSPAEYLKVKSCNKSLLKELKTRHNTKKRKLLLNWEILPPTEKPYYLL